MVLNFLPSVIIVGRTNVGKSSLFNRLLNKRISISHQTPGATRDCIMKEADLLGCKIRLIDSGGIESCTLDNHNPFQSLITNRVFSFLENKASLVLFVVSAQDGITPQDLDLLSGLRKLGKTILPVINKADNPDNIEKFTADFAPLGLDGFLVISALHNFGLDDLRQKLLQLLGLSHTNLTPSISTLDPMQGEQKDCHVAIIGKPNAGKSTLVNAILGEDVVMTSELPGTTVDAIDTNFYYSNTNFTLVDTAGVRRQKSVYEEVEKMAIARTLCAIDRAEVSILLISAVDGVTEQDTKIAGFVFEKKKSLIIAVNKWDGAIVSEKNKKKLLEDIRYNLSFVAFAPVVFISAKKGTKIHSILDLSRKLSHRFNSQINTSKLNRALEKASEQHSPPVFLGRKLKMYFAHQIHSAPPTFNIACSNPKGFHFSYKRYLMNYFRDHLDLKETPLRLIFKRKN